MIPKDTPNPGSREAIEQGCTCPVMDDAHGARHSVGPGWRAAVLD